MNKIIRTICYFTKNLSAETIKTVDGIAAVLTQAGFSIQTKRICSPDVDALKELEKTLAEGYIIGAGTIDRPALPKLLPKIMTAKSIAWNLDITAAVSLSDVSILTAIISKRPELTFSFTYVVNNAPSSPYFPSATYEKEGFALGLQPTDLSEGCTSLQQWLDNMNTVWTELNQLFEGNSDFLGIDSSIAPIYSGNGSFINFIRRLSMDFTRSVTTDTYTTITKFIKSKNPKPVGLCGLMFPCLEDFELAEEYERGNFSIERNVYLSLHSGLGIDTYPVGIDEKPERILEILELVRALSNKYTKPLAIRFVSDGKAKVGENTDFKNQYLKDVVVRPI